MAQTICLGKNSTSMLRLYELILAKHDFLKGE